jgi:hypothetical protein
VLSHVRHLVQFARQQGYGPDEVIQMVRDLPQMPDRHPERGKAALARS